MNIDKCNYFPGRKGIEDNPEFIIFQNLLKPDNHSSWWGLCGIKCNDSNLATLVAKPASFLGHKLEYDRSNHIIYKNSKDFIEKILLDGEVLKVNRNDLHVPMRGILSIALDWVTQNLYFMIDNSIRVISLSDKSKPMKTILTLREKVEDPVLKVHPNRGYLFLKVTRK